MRSISLSAPSGRYLSFAEREEIAILRAQRLGVRAIARRLSRSPSTISRELRRNAATRGGRVEYPATTAQWHADRQGRRPKTAKLAASERLRDYVQGRLSGTLRTPEGAPVPGPNTRWIGPSAWAPTGSPLGHRVELGTDRPTAARGLPR
jgi:hypothetical protein